MYYFDCDAFAAMAREAMRVQMGGEPTGDPVDASMLPTFPECLRNWSSRKGTSLLRGGGGRHVWCASSDDRCKGSGCEGVVSNLWGLEACYRSIESLCWWGVQADVAVSLEYEAGCVFSTTSLVLKSKRVDNNLVLPQANYWDRVSCCCEFLFFNRCWKVYFTNYDAVPWGLLEHIR